MTNQPIQVGQIWAHRTTGRQVEVAAINPGNLLEIRHLNGGPFPNRRTNPADGRQPPPQLPTHPPTRRRTAMPEDVEATTLTAADLPTLRRLAAHYRARGAHLGGAGAVVSHALAAVCDRSIRLIAEHGEMRPEINYRRKVNR